MTKLMEFKDGLFRFWGKYEFYLQMAVKFVVAFVLFWLIGHNIGYMDRISGLPAMLILSLVCAILPRQGIIWISAIVVLLDMYALSIEAAGVALVLFAILLLVYFRFAPKDGFAVVLMPICFKLHIPYVMPVCCSLLRSVVSLIAMACGTVVYYFLDGIQQNAAVLSSTAEEDTTASKLSIVVGQIIGNKEMYLVVGIFVVASIVVYIVRSLSVEHAWTLAIISGTLVEIAGLFVGYLLLSLSSQTLWLLLGCVISMVIEFAVEFLFMDLDYARTEHVQFEDDDYYYYVKAVPKKMVALRDVKVKHFGNTESIGKKIEHKETKLSDEQEAASRKVIARELDIDEDLLK
ncbi:MAG: hypothetical protein LUI02_05495 [Clostridiales bacterium]|nr:hypothetical protein [Clostridiales bacterium]